MKKITGTLAKQLNNILNKENKDNTDFSLEELNTIKSLSISKRDLPYLDFLGSLEEIEISSFPSINNDDILFIGRKLPNIKSLKIKEQNALFVLNLSMFNKLENLCIIHNDNICEIVGLNRIKKFTFYDNKDYTNIKQIVDFLLLNQNSYITLDIMYYVDIVNYLFDKGMESSVLDKFTWIESIGLRKYNTYEYDNSEIDSLLKYISYVASKYVYSTDDEIMKFCILYTWIINNMKFVNEDDPEDENLNLISNVNKVFSYGRGGRLSLAKAFQLLLSFVGIKSSVVYSMGATDVIGVYNGEKVCSLLGESDYAVLRVSLEQKNYYCDIAWDTLINFHGFFDQLRFFLFSKNELKTRHKFVGEGNIDSSYSYHGDDCDELLKKASERIKEVDEIFEDIERLKPEITGKELNIAILKLKINDLSNEIDKLAIDSENYKNKMLELTSIEDEIDNISSELIRLENNREGIIKSYSNFLLDTYMNSEKNLEKSEKLDVLNRKEQVLLISDYMANLLRECLK